ncbi:MAG: hypothetical protein H0W73_15760 [Bacteroidetes bacterium]|nr:hypothetical protein [Bacteroidota bacterium]
MWQNQIIFNYKYSQKKMMIEKILHKIQTQINDLTPTLELFVDETIQPSVDSCEKLQKQLTEIQENLAVYKYNKINKEISPSFSIHAKVSEKELPKKTEELKNETKVTIHEEKPELLQPKIEPETGDVNESKNVQPMLIGINDKFRFINELFKQNNSEYNIAVEQLNTLKNWRDAEIYLNSLKTLYEWKDNSEVANLFFSVTKKRFS